MSLIGWAPGLRSSRPKATAPSFAQAVRLAGEALIMTALGLAVAIPAVLGYNALVRGNKSVLHKLNRFAYDLHSYFVTGARVSASEAELEGFAHDLREMIIDAGRGA